MVCPLPVQRLKKYWTRIQRRATLSGHSIRLDKDVNSPTFGKRTTGTGLMEFFLSTLPAYATIQFQKELLGKFPENCRETGGMVMKNDVPLCQAPEHFESALNNMNSEL